MIRQAESAEGSLDFLIGSLALDTKCVSRGATPKKQRREGRGARRAGKARPGADVRRQPAVIKRGP
eukprot:scaffold293542_cov36-Tisochrysis_lutea.AAC.1